MAVDVELLLVSLQTDADWRTLVTRVISQEPVIAVEQLVRHVRSLGATAALVESPYIDRDYSAEYRFFHGQLFQSVSRVCKRIHFFAYDRIDAVLSEPDWLVRARTLQGLPRDAYLGFTVVKPLPHAPLGRTVLRPNLSLPNLEVTLTCRAPYEANLLGARLKAIGAAFIQQDGRISSCAQAAIWMAARQMHKRHEYDWHSTVDITTIASQSADDYVSAQLPAGSESLPADGMTRSLKAMGFQPLLYDVDWLKDFPSTILRYAESGLPVILGLAGPENHPGHAVTVVGTIAKRGQDPLPLAPNGASTGAAFVRALLVHDDSAGPYRILPLTQEAAADPDLPTEAMMLNDDGTARVLDVDAVSILIPMPPKVFCKAEKAEELASAAVRNMLGALEKRHKAGEQVHSRAAELISAWRGGELFYRTYLTSAAGYRRHLAHSLASNRTKELMLPRHLPHFVWVTEVATVGSFNNPSPGMRLVYGHVVVDATASGLWMRAVLMLHLPGIVAVRDVDAEPLGLAPPETGHIVEDDVLYQSRQKRLD